PSFIIIIIIIIIMLQFYFLDEVELSFFKPCVFAVVLVSEAADQCTRDVT
ncbi:uncharacterized, partial [Tachysurus ichikawai]